MNLCKNTKNQSWQSTRYNQGQRLSSCGYYACAFWKHSHVVYKISEKVRDKLFTKPY